MDPNQAKKPVHREERKLFTDFLPECSVSAKELTLPLHFFWMSPRERKVVLGIPYMIESLTVASSLHCMVL